MYEDEPAAARGQSTSQLESDATLPRSQGGQELRVPIPERDERDAAVRGRSDHRVGTLLQRGEGLAEGGTRRRDVSADENRITGKGARSPGDPGQAVAEGGAALWDPEGVPVLGKKMTPGGSVLGRRREDQPRTAAASRVEPAGRETREEVRASRAETFLVSLPARLPGEQDEIAIHFA